MLIIGKQVASQEANRTSVPQVAYLRPAQVGASGQLINPIHNSNAANLMKMSYVTRDEGCPICQHDAGDKKIRETNLTMRFASPQSSKVLLSTLLEFHNQDLCEEFFGSR